jgi:type VI secretion system protein ImpM
MIPSVDRVGRYFPLIAVQGLPEGVAIQRCLPPASGWYPATRELLLRALRESLSPDALMVAFAEVTLYDPGHADMAMPDGDIFSVLGDFGMGNGDQMPEVFSWPDMPLLFEARNDRSFWWTEPTAAQPVRQVIHRGTPDTGLFAQLFGPATH